MYITREHLLRITDSASKGKPCLESRQYASERPMDATVFLSHKHDEKDLLLQIKTLFETLGMNVYVDWMDQSMQHPTNAQTAKDLRTKIKSQNKFVLIATDAAVRAPWCNWELGIADAIKDGADNIAIIPIADSNGCWKNNEYLQVYPKIVYYDGMTRNSNGCYISKGYYVVQPNNTYQKLEAWLKNGMPTTKFL